MTFLFLLQLDEFDAYIIVSFVNATLVLSIGETVEEVTDSGFLGTTPTLSCSLLGDDALVQVRISCVFLWPSFQGYWGTLVGLFRDCQDMHLAVVLLSWLESCSPHSPRESNSLDFLSYKGSNLQTIKCMEGLEWLANCKAFEVILCDTFCMSKVCYVYCLDITCALTS